MKRKGFAPVASTGLGFEVVGMGEGVVCFHETTFSHFGGVSSPSLASTVESLHAPSPRAPYSNVLASKEPNALRSPLASADAGGAGCRSASSWVGDEAGRGRRTLLAGIEWGVAAEDGGRDWAPEGGTANELITPSGAEVMIARTRSISSVLLTLRAGIDLR